jgi:hypothetical protein
MINGILGNWKITNSHIPISGHIRRDATAKAQDWLVAQIGSYENLRGQLFFGFKNPRRLSDSISCAASAGSFGLD